MDIQFNLQDFYLFGFNYNGGEPDEVIVAKPTAIYEDKILFHFLYNYKSLTEDVYKKDIIAVGDINGTVAIAGWTGKYKIINQEVFDDLVSKGVIVLK